MGCSSRQVPNKNSISLSDVMSDYVIFQTENKIIIVGWQFGHSGREQHFKTFTNQYKCCEIKINYTEVREWVTFKLRFMFACVSYLKICLMTSVFI